MIKKKFKLGDIAMINGNASKSWEIACFTGCYGIVSAITKKCILTLNTSTKKISKLKYGKYFNTRVDIILENGQVKTCWFSNHELTHLKMNVN